MSAATEERVTSILDVIDELMRTLPVEFTEELDDDFVHFVCHCTDNKVSGCGRWLGDGELEDDDEGEECPECIESWPAGRPCPWGCTCGECRTTY